MQSPSTCSRRPLKMASRSRRQAPRFAICLRTILCVDQVAGTAQLRAGDRRLVAAHWTDSIGARRIPLLAGRREDGQLVLVGQVGSGFSDTERRRLYSLLDGLAQEAPPVPDAPAIGGSPGFVPGMSVKWLSGSTTAPEACDTPPGKDCARAGLPMSACPTNCNRESATTR